MIPAWLHVLAIACLILGFAIAIWIGWDVARHPQHMWIMNVVWPIVALFGTVFALWAYLRYGRLSSQTAMDESEGGAHKPKIPFSVMVGKGAGHCGAGCTLGDIIAEWLAFAFPVIAVWLGYQSLFAEKMFAVWVLDFIFAFAFGIVFQYFTIKPMRNLTPAQGIVQAFKADTLSLTAWQIGMYGFMAVAQFIIFRGWLDHRLEVNSVEFWFMMQIAMIAGFIMSYPVNWWLLKRGIKERM
ncbi:MAG: DUF4396 domain-containing protein [Xanthobacteraceae bacterium]